MAMEAEIGVAPFELGGGGGRQASDSGGLKSWKKQGNRFPSEPGAGSVGPFWTSALHRERVGVRGSESPGP